MIHQLEFENMTCKSCNEPIVIMRLFIENKGYPPRGEERRGIFSLGRYRSQSQVFHGEKQLFERQVKVAELQR